MVSLDEKRNREYSIGNIIYVDSNFARAYDCFGVVIEKEFWRTNVQKDYLEFTKSNLAKGVFEKFVLFKVLGERKFRQPWKEKGIEDIKKKEIVMSYRGQNQVYVDPINLLPLIETAKIDGGRVRETLFGNNVYVLESLREAEIIYDYMDGKRFDKEKERKFIHKEDKLLRLLEQAIPIKPTDF